MTPRRMSQGLEINGGRICCKGCGHPISVAGSSWKPHAALVETLLANAPGMGAAVRRAAILRLFCCPTCGALLDTETAVPGDPYLVDILEP
jgi:acetone carboxylase gamma subunit